MSLPEGGPEPTVFEERLTSGLYDELVESLQAMGNSALGNVDCPNDFTRHQPQYSNNIEFRTSDGGLDFRTAIVGEVAGSLQGTVLRAIGNYYSSEPAMQFQPINDSKKSVKDVLALVTPTLACNRLANFFQNQTVPLRDAIEHELALESRAVPYQEYILRPWMRSIQEDSGQDDIIMVHMLPKYGVPASAGTATASPARRGKRKLDDVVQPSTNSPAVAANSGSSESSVCKPDASQIRLGAYYDPRLLCDYGGDYFRQVKAMLVQLDVRDATARGPADSEDPLVPPWDFYDRLRPGTLVLVDASLHIFVMNDTDSKGAIRPKKRKIYQINAHSIKILAKSDFPIEERKVLIPRGFDGSSSTVSAPPPAAFASFSLKTPSKNDRDAAISSGASPSSSVRGGSSGSRSASARVPDSAGRPGSSVVAGSSQSAAPSGSSSLSQGSVVDIDVDVPDADSVKSKRACSAGKKIGAASSSS
ncbi:hypothetical protein R3P38DRAFT_2799750 [Favolaschia claudopus]|uniref:Uncharacterized protein n=1 Tax=Favolaschia claudopus TaxID=2862362 RepID=A0AAV9ZYX3_9AGAR